ncbi:unnamed protein product [Candidula unifasciata]|uniref:Uncharacterized protein n=1 Tax=Candidula unifasciata TaxID=100452 RepID=A0A8S3Z0K9_9EUPU|nr:unnamed protein product [Candidula unifasciata]
MFCFCGRRGTKDDEDSLILDVEQILQDHVWELFLQRQSRIQRLCLRRTDFHVNVPMNFFHFETLKQKVNPRYRPETGEDGHILDQKTREENTTASEKAPRSKFGKERSSNSNIVEIATDFVNDTDREQTYKFRLEKTRKAVLNVSYQRGFTVGGRARFSVGLPKLVSDSQSSVETDMIINVTKQEGENVEETVVLETTSDIKVKERSKYIAKVVLAEVKVSYDFAVWCRISMPKKDGEVVFNCTLKRLDKIFDRFKNQIKITTAPSNLQTENYVVDIKNTGIIEGVRLSDQRIILESTDLHKSSNVNDKLSSEKMVINIDYVPQLSTAPYPHIGSSLQRPRSIEGPIIEEAAEDDEDCSRSLTSLPTLRNPPRTPTNRPPSMGMIPTVIAASPSSVGSSPLSEKSGSDVSVSKTTTTV